MPCLITRLTLLILFLLMGACDRSSEPGLSPFDGFRSASEVTPSSPVEATSVQRRHDARNKAAWKAILNRLSDAITAIADARQFCGPSKHGSEADPPRESIERESFERLQSRIEAECERLNTDIAQIDPTGSASALFLPSRRLNRNIRTVLLSTLEISCPTPAILDTRLESARLQLRNLQDYLDAL